MLRLCASLVLAATLASAAVQEYLIEPDDSSRFALEVYKTGLMSGKKHLFLFSRYHGTLSYDAAAPENSHIRLEIDAASASCKDDWVSDSQRLEIEKYALDEMMAVKDNPKMVFTSESISAAGAGGFTVRGRLRIRGLERPVTVAVKLEARSDGAVRFTGSAAVNLKDYGIKPRRAALGMIGTKKEMNASFDLLARPHGE